MRIFTSQLFSKEKFNKPQKIKTHKKTAQPFFFDKRMAAVFWLILWQVVSVTMQNDLLLPSPIAVLGRMCQLLVTTHFWSVTAASLLRICGGFLLGLVVGALLAVVTEISTVLKTIVALPMAVIKATPVASFVILALLFIGTKYFSLFISFLMMLPLSWNNISEGIRNTDSKLLEMAEAYRLSNVTKLRSIYFPSVRPFVLSACKTGLGFCWKAGIAGEVIAIPKMAIGTQLYNAKIYLETTELFAWTGFIILLSLLLESLTVKLLGKFSGYIDRKAGV